MNTILGVMDRDGFDANTDNLVLVQPALERLLWIPRDLWCGSLRNRVNAAFRIGGHDRLVEALGEHGLTVTHSLVLSRAASESALAHVRVLVPIPVRMSFAYPLAPTARIEDGRRQVEFTPPAEVLSGERVHQWIGARGASDLHRIERQKILIRRLLEQRFDFRRALANPAWFRCSDDAALDDLARVHAGWRLDTLGAMEPETIDGMQVLVRR